MKILQHNVLNWSGRRFGLINSYKIIDPDIILINSHGTTTQTPLQIPGYTTHKRNLLNRPMDGTAIAVKNNIQHKILDHFISDTIATEIQTHTGKIIIATAYLPPSRPYLPTPDFVNLFRRNIPVYLIGDLNAKHRLLGNRNSNIVGKQLARLITDTTLRFLGPHFPTFHSLHSSTTPDIALSNLAAYHNILFTPGPLTTSDHTPIIATISTAPVYVPIPPRPNFTLANWNQFKQELETSFGNFPNPEFGTLEEIDQCLDCWYSKIQTAIKNNIPTTTHRTITYSRHSRDTQILINQYNALRTHSMTHGWTRAHYRHYKSLQAQLHISLLTEHNNHWSNIITNTVNTYNDPSTFWRKIKTLSGNSVPDPHYVLDSRGIRQHSSLEKEATHRNHWEPIFQEADVDLNNNNHENIVREFLNDNLDRITPFPTADPARLDSNSPFTCPITEEEISDIIKSMKKTCPGDSGFNKTILMNLPNISKYILKNIFNATISAGYFPDKFKEASIKLIPKKNKNPHLVENYRPISLLEVPGKILERIVNKRLRFHLETNNLYNENQYGFRYHRGTTHAIALATEHIAINKANKGQCHVVLRDITKAFDKVWHLGLKYKLLNHDLPIITEKLLCDFLDDRRAKIKINYYSGASFALGCGVPQGSVLSPTLFTIYTSDTPQATYGINISYADDITQLIKYPGPSRNIMNSRTKHDVEKINSHEIKWKIQTNIHKFSVIQLANTRREPLIIDEDLIDFKDEGKILGFKINTRGYLDSVNDRKHKAIGALSRLYRFKNMPTKIKTHLIKALVLPILEYPPIPTHTFSHAQVKKLQIVQNRALRFATNQHYPYTLTTEQIHHHTKTKPLNIRLHNQAKKIWGKIDAQNNDMFTRLKNTIEEGNLNFHKWFPSSLRAIERNPDPIY